MDLEKIEGLVKIIENSSLTEFTLKEGDLKITMSKLDNPPVVAAGVPACPAPARQRQKRLRSAGDGGRDAVHHFSHCGNLLFCSGS